MGIYITPKSERKVLKELNDENKNIMNLTSVKTIEVPRPKKHINPQTPKVMTNNGIKPMSHDCTTPPPGYGYYFEPEFSFPDFEELKIAVMEDSNLRKYLVQHLNHRRSIKNKQYNDAMSK